MMVKHKLTHIILVTISCQLCLAAFIGPVTAQLLPKPVLPVSANTSYQPSAGTWNSSIIYKGEDGALVYYSDENFNRIPDFSHAGYRGGGVPLPVLPVRITLSPSSTGDDTEQIQQALDAVGAMEPDENGHRGAVLLNPGEYRINERIRILQSGVVLRGSGDDEDPGQNTVIHAARRIGDGGRIPAMQVGRGDVDWNIMSGSPLTEIATEFVAVGNRNFEVVSAAGFEAGDEVVIFSAATREWIEAVDFGGIPETEPNPWIPGESSLNIAYQRIITGISGNIIEIDVPVYNHLNRDLSVPMVFKPNFSNRISESGVEHLRLVLESDSPVSANHAYNGIIFNGVTNSWAYGVTVLHFIHQGVGATNSTNVTIQNARALEPHSPVTSPYRYNFNVERRANNILFTDVHATEGRHCFVSNGTASASGIVFSNGTSRGAHSSSEGHRRWSSAMLFDNLTFTDPNRSSYLVGLFNRGSYGTRHGWSAAHSVVWNNTVPQSNIIIIQQPPTAQNYGIANRGTVSGSGPFPGTPGFIEGTGQTPEITSLYEAQLYDRLTLGVPPDTPTHLTLETNDQNTSVKLDWKHLSLEEMTILIQRSIDGGPFEELARISSSETSFVDEVTEQGFYRYRIAAVDNGRMSGWSNLSGFDMSLPSFNLRSPAAGTTVQLTGESTSNVNLWWTATTSGFPISYAWYLDQLDGDFSEPLLERTSTQQLIQITYGELDEALETAGVERDATFEGKWTVKATAGPLATWADEPFGLQILRGMVTASDEQVSAELPQHLELRQNFPNPFNPETMISFGLPESGRVELVIYDIMGREVSRLVDGYLDAGWHQIRWDASRFASGTYIYRIQVDGKAQTRIMMLLK
ncbi:MAG: T9SS C-terminal target domain-containing protein [Balneolaceae bacterium]|nr:MAG: T9SS C-terminal target domain-containing protein [Balneolaceae bacterium]